MASFAIPEQRYTICIGINHYPHHDRTPTIPNAEEDAQKVDMAFARMGIPAHQRLLLLGQEATLTKLNNVLARFFCGYPSRKDAIFFYYAGYLIPHLKGTNDEAASAYADVLFATADSPRYLHQPHIALPGLKSLREEYSAESRARHLFCILDGYAPPYSQQGLRHTLHITQQLSQLMSHTAPGHIALSSYVPLENTLDPVIHRQRFSTHLIQALEGNATPALYGKDHILTTRSLYNYVTQQLAPLRQHPILSYTISDNFFISRYSANTVQLEGPTNETQPLHRLRPASQSLPNTQPIEATPPPIEPAATPPPFFIPKSTLPPAKNAPVEEVGTLAAKITRLHIAVCSSTRDLVYAQEFRDHLYSIKQQKNVVAYWDTGAIPPNQRKNEHIVQSVWSANIVLLLLSPDFLTEFDKRFIQPLFTAANGGKTVVIPLKAQPCSLEHTYLENVTLLDEIALQSCKDLRERQKIWLKVIYIVRAELRKHDLL